MNQVFKTKLNHKSQIGIKGKAKFRIKECYWDKIKGKNKSKILTLLTKSLTIQVENRNTLVPHSSQIIIQMSQNRT